MERKFQGVTYDLCQNILRYNKEIESLKDYSLNLCIGKNFKKHFINKHTQIKKFVTSSTINPKMYESFQKIEGNICDEILTVVRSKSCASIFTLKMVQERIHFIGMQLLDFLKKKKTHLIPVKLENFISVMVFTSQGTINMSKTVFRINKSLQLPPLENFIFKCHLFLENEIKVCYDALKDDEKKTIYKRIKDDFILEFWVLEIRYSVCTGKTLNKYYLEKNADDYERFFVKAIETNNEIGVAYLWYNRISKLTTGRNLLKEAFKMFVLNSLKTNILMFLLFQVNENEFDDFYESSFLKIIKNIVSEVRWHCFFDKIIEVFKSHRLSKTFGILTNSHFTSSAGVSLDSLVNIFSAMPDYVKLFIKNESTPDPSHSQSSTFNNYLKVLAEVVDTKKEDLIKKFTTAKDGTALEYYSNSNSYSNSLSHKPKRFKKH